MNDTKQVLLTFDYEMFLGKSGTIDNCMILPTEELIKVLAKKKVKATFFVDTTFLLMLRNTRNFTEFDKVKKQLVRLVSYGHRIELHIHPHWVDATYNTSTLHWDFNDFRYYQLKNTPPHILRDLFIKGVELLKEIALEVDSEYIPEAYRAGGWCVDPFENLVELFRETGIWIDSSVLPTIKTEGNIANYDYSNIKHFSPYFFNQSVHEVLNNGEFLEIPLSIIDVDLSYRICRKIKIKSKPQQYTYFGDGSVIFSSDMQGKKKNFKEFFEMKFMTNPEVLSIDGAASFSKIRNVIRQNQTSTIVGHPKLLTNTSLNCLIKLLKLDEFNFVDISKFAFSIKGGL